jgi:signal transduction histidine kinase
MAKSPLDAGSDGARENQRADRAIILQWMSGPAAASPWIGVIFAINVLVTGFVVPDVAYDGITGHEIDLIAGLSVLAVYFAARRIRPVRANNRLAGNVLLWAVAGEMSVLVPLIVSAVVAGRPNPDLTQISLTGAIAYPLLNATFALIYSGLRSSRATSRELSQSRRSLVAMRNALDDEIASERAALVREVETQLRAGFESLDGNSVPDAKALRSVVDDVVRPLSWKLESSDIVGGLATAASLPSLSLVETRRSLFRRNAEGYRYRVALGRLISPFLVAGAFIVFALPSTFYIYGAPGLVFGLVTFIALALSVVALKKLFGHVRVGRTLGIFVSALVAAVSSLSFSLLLALAGMDWVSGLSICLVSALITGFSGLFFGFVARRADSFAEARRVNDEINELVTRLRQEVWVTRKQLARVVHGQVQSKLVAASLRLARSLRDATQNDALQEQNKAQQDVRDAVALISHLSASAAAVSDRSLELEVEELSEVWEGVCAVTLEIDDQAGARLREDSVATSCVTEVIRETVSNAVKHSKAPAVTATVSLRTPSRALVVLRNVGTLANASAESAAESGYGTRIMDDVTVSWSVTQVGTEVELRAEIALASR